jgi:glutamate receptor, ionotropic, invertebrate
MLKETAEKLSGNDRFEGIGIDLIHELSLMLGFNYTFVLQENGVYGSLNRETGKWNGMIRELHEFVSNNSPFRLQHNNINNNLQRADLAITDLTITSERESAVDFTMPFMNLGTLINNLSKFKTI